MDMDIMATMAAMAVEEDCSVVVVMVAAGEEEEEVMEGAVVVEAHESLSSNCSSADGDGGRGVQ